MAGSLQNTERTVREELAGNRSEISAASRQVREELSASIRGFMDTVEAKLTTLQRQVNSDAGQNREELSRSLKSFEENFRISVGEFNELQRQKFDTIAAEMNRLVQGTETKLEKLRDTVEAKLRTMQEDNSQKLERIRATVDEKLHETLEKRLGDSFKLVSERLELVHKGLGEMQTLAAGVGDLKKTLVNVKTRGTLGEIQLGNILEQILTKDQYVVNVATCKGSSERVEFAIKMPGHDDKPVLLPLDAKFPLEDYQRLLDAYETADPAMVEEAAKQLETRVKMCAKTIRDKYLEPPHTTDFGIMFLPVEGLYAEVLRRAGLFETLTRDYRVAVTGPTTLAAFLNSLQMGFRTLAIEKRSSEVWSLLSTVKTEFGKFGDILDKTQKKLKEASSTIEAATQKTRSIERKLRDVEELPSGTEQGLSC
ncbi:MAG: DNA recombination protein RmuC [Bacillota bacterium]